MICDCCDHIYENGRKRETRPAAYQWTGPNGHTVPLCPSCCAYWRLNAADDPWLTPLRIISIDSAPR